uniref:Uncharacterized protein n=1 Tax=Heliothis virescens TaxID=7102 RepID=A0A2A4JFH1_HELVI
MWSLSTDEYDDADTWIATMYDDAVMDFKTSSTPKLPSSPNASNHVVPWNNNLSNVCERLQINTQEPSTSAPTSDHKGKSQQKPLNNDSQQQPTLKRKLSTNEIDENNQKLLKTFKTEPLDENDNYSSNASENKENYVNHQEELSSILIDDINDIIDMIDNSNKNFSSNTNKTFSNALAHNGELAKLLLEEPGNKNVNVSNENLESSIQNLKRTEFNIKEEISSPILIDISDGEEGADIRDKETDKNKAKEISTMHPNTVTPIQSEQTVELNKSKPPEHSLPHNDKENQLTRLFEINDSEQRKLTHQTDEKITDMQRLLNLTVTHGILKEKSHKTPENYRASMQNPNPYPVNTEKTNKNPDNDKITNDPFLPENTLKSLIQNTQTISNEPFRLPQESIEDINSSAFKVLVQKDEHLNRIIITRSEEPESKKFRKSNNERVERKLSAQNKPNNTLPEPPSNTADSVQTQNPLIALTKSMQRFSNVENQPVRITRHLNQQAPPHNQNPQNSQHLHKMFHRFRYDRWSQPIERMNDERQQNIAKTNKPQEPAKTANLQGESPTNGPKIKGYLLEDPRTGQVFIHPTAPDNIEQRPEYHHPEKNKNTECHKPPSVNQPSNLPQPRPQLQENQFVRTSGGTFYPANQPERLPQPMNVHGNNPRPQMNPQNPLGVPYSFQPPNYFESYPQGRRFSPASQDSNYQDSRMQQPPMRPGPNERPMAPPNVNVGYQTCTPARSLGDDRFSSNPSLRPHSSYEARMEEWFRSLSQKLDFIYAKLSKM